MEKRGIGRSDVVRHPVAAVQSLGLKGGIEALSGTPVVDVARRRAECRGPRGSVMSLFEDYAKLEHRAAEIYRRLAELRRDRPEAFRFLQALVGQERRHAEVLILAGIEASCSDVPDQVFQLPRERYPSLCKAFDEWDAAITPGMKDEEMVAMIIAIESSELDAIYDTLVASSKAAFPLALYHGVDAQWYHLDFIQKGLDTLRPKEPAPEDAGS